MAVSLIILPATLAALIVLRHFLLQGRKKRLPPGPKGLFLIGNLQDFPKSDAEQAKTYVKWRENYGEIMRLEIFGKHTIILNTVQATRDLMDKRAAIYSDRPRMPMLIELAGMNWAFSIISGEPHKERRSLAQRYFLARIKDWQHVQVDSARTLLRNLTANPDDWAALINLSVASSVLRICYGHEVKDLNDSLLKTVQDALQVANPFAYNLLSDDIAVKWYPSWLPGGGFHKDAAETGVVSERLRTVPFNAVLSKVAAGTASPSFISTLLSELPQEENLERSHQVGIIRDAVTVMYGAAVDSSVSLMCTFIGSMVLHPEIQRRAQSELDSVLGQDRLPTFDDRSALQFIDCIILEVLRWNIIAPLGLPHMLTEDDEYLGYRLPKGSTVLGNTWAILRDPDTFPNPEIFDPARFLLTTPGSAIARDTVESTVFGWGRRTCPGRHVGSSSLFIMIAHILACFDIKKPVNDAGEEVEPVLEFHQTLFACTAYPLQDKNAVGQNFKLARPPGMKERPMCAFGKR